MLPTATLTLGLGRAGEGVVLGIPGSAAATGDLDLADLEARRAEITRALRAPAGLLLADTDVHISARERAAGQALADLLDQPGLRSLRDTLVAWQARHAPVQLLIDARTASLRTLPWELLCAVPPGRSPLAVSRLARLQPAPPPALPAPAERFSVRLWVADPEDAITRGLAQALTTCLAELPTVSIERVPATLSGAPRTTGPAVLHLLAHGASALEQVGLNGPAGARSAETVARGLARWSSGCLLALTDVCGGAQATSDAADAPTWRLAMGGPGVVVGPRSRWGVEASTVFSEALYRALARGEAVGKAVAKARQALRFLAIAHHSSRWWTPLLITSAPMALGLCLALPPVAVPAWPAGAPETVPLLRIALSHARGYLGVEHLLLALATPNLPLPAHLSALRPALAQLAATVPAQPLAGPPEPTPRLLALGKDLHPGFDLAALARALCLVPWVTAALDPAARARIMAPSNDDGRATLAVEAGSPPMTAPSDASLVLEVETGPEDGRLLTLYEPGETVGRWDPGRPDQRHNRLLCNRDDADRTLSRQHLVLQGPRQIMLRGASRLVRASAPARSVQGPLLVQTGDLLVLGTATRLRVR